MDWSIVVAAYWAAARAHHWLAYGIAILIIGTRQHALGILAHDGAHGLISRNRMVNRLLTELGAWPLFVNVHGGYKEWHWEHHRELGTNADSELFGFRRLPAYQAPVSLARVIALFCTALLGLGLHELIMFVVLVRPRGFMNWLLLSGFWVAVFGIAWWLGVLWVPLMWIVALCTSFWAVFRVRTFGEHVGTLAGPGQEASHRHEVGLLGRFFFFPHNVWYHYEHHLYAAVPFFNLPKVRALDQRRPVIPFHAILRRPASVTNATPCEKQTLESSL
jgi:fatty acid desaturase